MRERWRGAVDWVRSIGAYPGETEVQRGRRRAVVVASLLASTLSTVNIASRTESEGVPGQIQVSRATHDALAGGGYTFEPRGLNPVKGRGEMETYLLRGRT